MVTSGYSSAAEYDIAGITDTWLVGALEHFYQGLVTVSFWEYWTSPYSSHYRPYT
jgi:hypothetical protein